MTSIVKTESTCVNLEGSGLIWIRAKAVVLLFNVFPIVCGGSAFGPCFVNQYLCLSSFAIILMRKTELFILL